MATAVKGLLELPEEILEKIFSYVSYENASESRLVSRNFNRICQQHMNKGFIKADKFHNQCQREVRCQLPRRESERRNHPLARHVDILAAIETRLSLLNMTFTKYIDMGLCSFIPGKVLDEIFRVLRLVQREQKPPRAHELLQELRDISSMAMEHFDEKIVPILKAKMPPMPLSLSPSLPIASTSSGPSFRVDSSGNLMNNRIPALRQDIVQMKNHVRSIHMAVVGLKKEGTKTQLEELKRKIIDQEKRISDQERLLAEQSRKIADRDKLLNDLNQKILEYDEKFVDVLSELAKVRTTPGETDPKLSSSSSSSAAKDCLSNKKTSNSNSKPKRQTKNSSNNNDHCENVGKTDGIQPAKTVEKTTRSSTIEASESSSRKRRCTTNKSGGKGGPVKRSRVH